VEVAARLPLSLLFHLRTVLESEHSLTVVDGWDELIEVVRSRPIDVVIADPRADGTIRTLELRALLGRYPTLPMVLYTSLSPESLKATVELAQCGAHHVVLRGFDDEPTRFRELLGRLPAFRLGEIVLRGLEMYLANGPPLLKRAITQLFEAPHGFQSVKDLALAAGMTRRNLDRWLDKIGLASARMLILGARVTRAFYYMRDPGYLLDDITKKLGYSSPRLFARQVRAATGLTPSLLRETVEPEVFMAQLTALLCRRGGGRGDDDL
jgi:AraC-like DNA-binding protein